MVPLTSRLENREDRFDQWNDYFERYEFTLGGNWEYDHGYFDHYLDEEHKVWLRIPFEVTNGELDAEEAGSDAVVKLGQPFVLKHLYNDGLDNEAVPNVYGALVNQFQEPIDKDDEVEPKWVDEAKTLLNKVEQGLVH